MSRFNLNISCMKFHGHYWCNTRPIKLLVCFNQCYNRKIDHSRYFSYKTSLYSASLAKYNSIPLLSPNSLLTCTHISGNNVRCISIANQKDIPHVSATHMKNILNSNKLEMFDGFTCFVIRCPFCINTKKNELYVNKVTGFVICTGCKCSGQWIELEELLKRSKKLPSNQNHLTKYNNEAFEKWREVCKTEMPFTVLKAEEKKYIYDKLAVKELPDDLFERLNVHVVKDLSGIYIPLRYANSSEIVGYKIVKFNHRNSISKDDIENERVVQPDLEITEPCHNCRGVLLYKSKHAKKEQAVLVHNVKDFISLAQFNLNYHIVCLPHGLTNLPQDVLPILEKYKKIVLWFGNDTSCWDAARQFAKKLCEDRCYFVRPVKENPPAHVVAVTENSIIEAKRVIENAEPIRHPSIISFSSIRQDVLSELQNIDKVQGVRWQRFPGLNNLLKGFRRGELSIFTGPTGSGKTTFLSEYSLDLLTQGVSTLWGSFEVRNQRLARTMLQQYVQLPLDLYPEKLNYWADSFERLPLHFMTFHGQQPLKVVLEAVEHATYVYDIAHVIIDNVQFMLGVLDTETNLDRFYRQDALIASFRNFATAYNCHVTLVIHPRKEKDAEQLTVNSVFGGAKASQEADNVFIIQQKMLQSLKIKKYLQVAKNRFTGDLGLIPLDFDKETLSFSAKTDKKQQKRFDHDGVDGDGEGITKDVPVIDDLHILQ